MKVTFVGFGPKEVIVWRVAAWVVAASARRVRGETIVGVDLHGSLFV